MTTPVKNNSTPSTPIEPLGKEIVELVGDKLDCIDIIERIILVTKISSKICEPKTYKKAISDLIHTRQ